MCVRINVQGFIRTDNPVNNSLSSFCACVCVRECVCFSNPWLHVFLYTEHAGRSSAVVLHPLLCLQTGNPPGSSFPPYGSCISITFFERRSFLLDRFCGATSSIILCRMQRLMNLSNFWTLVFYVMYCFFVRGLFVFFWSRCTSNQMPNKLYPKGQPCLGVFFQGVIKAQVLLYVG